MDSENIIPPAEPSTPPEPKDYKPAASGATAENNPGSLPAGPKQFRGNRRRRFRRPNGPKGRQRQGASNHQNHQPNQSNQQNRGNGQNSSSGTVFTAPMDHSYRQSNGDVNGNTTANLPSRNQKRFGRNNGRNQGRNGRNNPFSQNNGARAGMPPAALGSPQIEPVPQHTDMSTRIFAFVEDLFFVTKMNETARKLNVRLEFIKTMDELLEKTNNGEEKPSLIVVDLNNANLRPLTVIPKLRAQFKKGTSILGFVPHVQGDLKVKAQEAGCDTVMPRSAFSANLPQIIRRHGGPEEIE